MTGGTISSLVRRVPLPLALLLGVAATLSLAWALATAPLQGFDEDHHVAYTARLAETGHLPKVSTGHQTYGDDEIAALGPLGYQRILQNTRARPPWSSLDEAAYRREEDAFPDGAPGRGDGPNPLGKNPPLYYAYEAIAWKLTPGGRFFDRLFFMRLGGTVLLLASVAFAWMLSGEVFRRTLPRTVATGVVALQPMAGYMSGIVNTDILLMTDWTLFLWLALRTVRLGLGLARVAGLAGVAGATILTHGRGLAIVPALALVLAVAWLRGRQPVWLVARSVAVAGAVVAIAVLVYRALSATAGGGALYGGEVNLGNTAAFSLRGFLGFVWQFYLPRLGFMNLRDGPAYGYRQVFVETFFGSFGSYEINFPIWLWDIVQGALLVLLVLLVVVVATHFGEVRRRWPQACTLVGSTVCVIGFLHVVSYRSVLGSNDPLITGRYLLPFIPLLGVGAATVVAGLPRRVGPYLGVVLLGGLAMLSITGLGLTLTRFYV